MRLFRSTPREHCITTLLRHMEHGRFEAAARELARYDGAGPLPPPHALWQLGRWLAEHGQLKRASRALKLLRDLYPRHADRAAILHDLARVLGMLGKKREAEALASEATELAKV